MVKMMKTTAIATALAALTTTGAMAATVSGTTMLTVNDGTVVDGTRSEPSSSFSSEFAISSDTATYMGMIYSVGSILLGDLPVVDGKFQFVFDSQETGGSPTISIDDIVLAVGSTEIWNYDEAAFGSLDLDGTTATPLGNGGDMGLYVDVSLFSGLGLTGSDTLDFFWKQSDANNGADEWVTIGDGFFGPDDEIAGPVVPPSPVPLPAGGLMLLSGLGGFAALKRRNTRKA